MRDASDGLINRNKFARSICEIKKTSDAKITKVSIIISKGSLDGIYPGLIMANGARAEGIEATTTAAGAGAIATDSRQ